MDEDSGPLGVFFIRQMRLHYLTARYVFCVRVIFLSRPGVVLKGGLQAFGIMLKELEHTYALLHTLTYVQCITNLTGAMIDIYE